MNKKSVIGGVMAHLEKRWKVLGNRFPDDVDAALGVLKTELHKFCEKRGVKIVHRHRLSIVFDSSMFQHKIDAEMDRTREEFVRVIVSAFSCAIFRGSPTRMAIDLIESMVEQMFSIVEENINSVPIKGSGLTVIK